MGEAACYEPLCPECKKPPPGARVQMQMDPGGSSGNQGVEKESLGAPIIPGGSRGLLGGPEESRGAPKIPRKSSGLKRKEN